MKAVKTIRTLLFGASAALTLLAAAPASAQVTDGSASAYALQADVLAPLISVGPIPASSVTGNDSDSASVVTLDAGSSLLGATLHVGILNSSASSDVDGSSGPKTASGMSSITEFDLDTTTFGLSFDTLTSNSTVSGDAGSFSAIGNSSIVDLMGSGLLAGIDTNISGAPNQTLLSLAGIEVIANRQTSSCTSFSCMMTTDALYVNIAGLANLTLASSTAELMGNTAPIPEPSTWAMMVAGLFGIGAMRKWKNRSA
jgi:hypothetical protein